MCNDWQYCVICGKYLLLLLLLEQFAEQNVIFGVLRMWCHSGHINMICWYVVKPDLWMDEKQLLLFDKWHSVMLAETGSHNSIDFVLTDTPVLGEQNLSDTL